MCTSAVWAKQIDLKTCSYNELYFYRALKRDAQTELDSRYTTSLESDAEMLIAIQQITFRSGRSNTASIHSVRSRPLATARFTGRFTFNRSAMVKLLLDHMRRAG